MVCSPPGSLSMRFSRSEYWSGLPCPPARDLSNPGIKPESLLSPALAGRFFTASATRECYFVTKARWTKIMRNFLRGKRPPERGTLVAFLLSGVNEIKMPGSRSQHGRAFPQDLRIPFQTLSLTHSSPHRCPDLNYKALGQAEGSSRVTFILCLNNNG